MTKIKRNPKSKELAELIIQNYDIEDAQDIDEALKDIFGPIFEAMLQGEMSHHLGYESNNKDFKETDNRRNGYGRKTLKTTKGNVSIEVPRDRDSSFEPQIIKKRQTDISDMESKVIAMYARGMSQRDISKTIEDIYGFSVSQEMISDITDAVLPELEEWQTRPLEKCYAFMFVDCMYVTIRSNYEAREFAVYTILGVNLSGNKEILGMWLSESESKNQWMHIFDELKSRGVEDIFFISMDGVSGLETGAKSIFPNAIVQRCIVHLVRNSLIYVPTKEYKKFTQGLKKIYGAPNLKAAQNAFETLKRDYSAYPGAIDVWERNWKHVEQLFDYGSDIRKVIYTTNAIEAIHSSFRKVTKKGAFPNENALLKVLYLRVLELQEKWKNGTIRNWAMVLNQLLVNDKISERLKKYSRI